jgi:hypothetical protein
MARISADILYTVQSLFISVTLRVRALGINCVKFAAFMMHAAICTI